MSESPANSPNAIREASWLLELMKDNPLWQKRESKHLLYAQPDREFVAWSVRQGQAQIDDVLSIHAAELSLSEGITLVLAGQSGFTTLVRHQPTLVPSLGIFVWVPAFTDLRFTPADYALGGASKRTLSVPFFVKVASNPHKHLVEGGDYFSTMQEFKQLWPDYPVEVA